MFSASFADLQLGATSSAKGEGTTASLTTVCAGSVVLPTALWNNKDWDAMESEVQRDISPHRETFALSEKKSVAGEEDLRQ
jgi:hypothetical protein